MRVNWNSGKNGSCALHFSDLMLNDSFRIVDGRGAVYVKVQHRDGTFGMLELATGKIFAPTLSEVELVEVEVNIKTVKPAIAGY